MGSQVCLAMEAPPPMPPASSKYRSFNTLLMAVGIQPKFRLLFGFDRGNLLTRNDLFIVSLVEASCEYGLECGHVSEEEGGSTDEATRH